MSDALKRKRKLLLLSVVKEIRAEYGCNYSCGICAQENNYPKRVCGKIAGKIAI